MALGTIRSVAFIGTGIMGAPIAAHILEAGYRRFIERRLREEFGFVGTPIRINLRIREKRRR